MFVDIILPLHLPKPLTYGVPLQWQDKIEIGKRVEVNLGRQRLYSGIVLNIHNNKPDAYQVKPIRNVIDEQAIVTPIQLAFWCWIAEYYLCSLNDVMQAALPAHLKLMSESLIIWTDFFNDVPQGLSDDAFVIAEALLIRKKMTIAEAQQLISGKALSAAINEVLETGAAIISEVLEERYKAKMESFVFLNEKYEADVHLKQLFDELDKKQFLLNQVSECLLCFEPHIAMGRVDFEFWCRVFQNVNEVHPKNLYCRLKQFVLL